MSLPPGVVQQNNPAGNGPMTYRENAAGREMTVVYKVPWEQITAFRNAVVGSPQTFTSGGISYTRTVPLQCPFDPGLYAVAIDGSFWGTAGTINEARPYAFAKFAVTFGLIPFGPGSDTPYQSLQAVGGLRSVTDQSQGYEFVGNGEPIDHGVAINHMMVSYLYTMFQVPNPASVEMALLALGETPVNDSPLTIGGITFAAGTVLLESYSLDRVQAIGGSVQSSLQIALNWSRLPWNSLRRSDGVVDEVSPQLYTPGDLSSVLNS